MTNLSKINKKKLHLSSTSYLLPQINEWNNLKKNFNLILWNLINLKLMRKKLFQKLL